jgi:uncharacterized iron-regulated membrane protein
MSSSHALLKYIRLIHLYLGVFIAPALLFFAFTGALQTFSLHETTRGSSYKPPVPVKKNPPPEKAASDKPSKQPADAPEPKHNALPLKIFFLLVSIGLFISTLSGIYMSYKYIRNRRLITALLLAGIILPIVLTIF